MTFTGSSSSNSDIINSIFGTSDDNNKIPDYGPNYANDPYSRRNMGFTTYTGIPSQPVYNVPAYAPYGTSPAPAPFPPMPTGGFSGSQNLPYMYGDNVSNISPTGSYPTGGYPGISDEEYGRQMSGYNPYSIGGI